MSDSEKDLTRNYAENVLEEQSRSFGLFPIPEYPELEAGRGMWSAALQALFTTLRYLAPATLLTLFWGQQSFLFRLLRSIDSAFRAIVFSSEEQKQEVLQWLAEAGPVRVEHLDTVWRHGWILCGVLDAALPGACAGHPPTRLSLKHAQNIADHYLGVEPVFSRQELECSDALSRHQEWKLATYLDRVRQALAKLTPPVSKPQSQRTSPEEVQFTLDYVAKGSGLTAAQVKNPMHFKIYPTSQQSMDPGEITILIRGPKDTYGMSVIPPVMGKAQLIRQNMLGLQSKPNYTENALPITQGTTYLRSFGKNDMNKLYYIPKTHYDIEIETQSLAEHAKISYVVHLEGKYEISITSRGQNIIGSPFVMTATKNMIDVLEKDNDWIEDGEEIDILDVKTDKKVVLRIVDFVTEKMLLKEDGVLEKISNEVAHHLMSTERASNEINDIDSRINVPTKKFNNYTKKPKSQFKKVAIKVVKMNRVCKIITSLVTHNAIKAKKKYNKEEPIKKVEGFSPPRSQQDIPDVVNSTFCEKSVNPFVINKQDKFIVPENIAFSLRTERMEEQEKGAVIDRSLSTDNVSFVHPDENQTHESFKNTAEFSSNPFVSNNYDENHSNDKKMGTFVNIDYETNNCQNEECSDIPIKILVQEESNSPSPVDLNPFCEPDVILERPKTPVLKIITGEVKHREDIPIYVDPKMESICQQSNEFINPFYQLCHQNEKLGPVTDFKIGAPVSLPPIIRASTPEPNKSLLITKDHESFDDSLFSTPLHSNKNKTNEDYKIDNNCSSVSSTFHSLDSNTTDKLENISLPSINNYVGYDNDKRSSRDITPKKDTWDSAYVSIDDSNSSPDSNNNDNQLCEIPSKQKFSVSDDSHDLSNMGPAERELWQTCSELQDNSKKQYEEIKISRWEVRRPLFTPIQEESDKCMFSTFKEPLRSDTNQEGAPETVAFAELQNVHKEYFASIGNSTEYREITSPRKVADLTRRYGGSVNSASELPDVKRHAKNSEGEISEVQSNVTESNSVSQTLQRCENNMHQHQNVQKNDKTEFENRKQNNIVLEKKQYWDERIREIEALSEKNNSQQKKRKLSLKNLRHNDSLTKRRGKELAKHFLNRSEDVVNSTAEPRKEKRFYSNPVSQTSLDEPSEPDGKLVEKWKKYWDEKLEIEKEVETTCFGTKSSASSQKSSPKKGDSTEKIASETPSPIKQELPEEMFKAFETSPKRFFGTSRKQILNKIDNFLGKQSTADEPSTEVSGASHHDCGLVSSRISLFRTISQSEELPSSRRCQSMHNISQRRDSEQSSISTEDGVVNKHGKSIEDNKVSKVIQSYEVETKAIDSQSSDDSLRKKRARLSKKTFSFEDIEDQVQHKQKVVIAPQLPSVKKVVGQYSEYKPSSRKSLAALHKSPFSKSEMDIFKKFEPKSEEKEFDQFKSCDELPRINVKNFISLYESVSKTDINQPVKKLNLSKNNSTSSGAVNKIGVTQSLSISEFSPIDTFSNSVSVTDLRPEYSRRLSEQSESEYIDNNSPLTAQQITSKPNNEKEDAYISLSDIELEIVDKTDEADLKKEIESAQTDYKTRFKMAKQFFQSMEDLGDTKKPKKLNECEIMLLESSTESVELKNESKPQKKSKSTIKKSHSMPSSEISKYWNQLQEANKDEGKLVKISEKYNVDDLFNDIKEGKLSRQGSLRGIPNKKAVLETFKSMENLADSKMSPYEIATSQIQNACKENKVKNAQEYLAEYPYLPKTDPSKYHSRLDAKAVGLITLKELMNQKTRRNSVPDLRNNKFSTNL